VLVPISSMTLYTFSAMCVSVCYGRFGGMTGLILARFAAFS
jgi:hypothetical protein